MALVLSGCAEKQINELSYSELKQVAAKIDAACDAAGAKEGTPERKICVDQEIRREDAERKNSVVQAARFRRGMSAMGDGLQQAGQTYSAPRFGPTVTCKTVPSYDGLGGTTTSCR
jgi:hypothetical protein